MRTLLATALVAAFVAAPVSAAPRGVPRDVRLSGRAGEVATFRLDGDTRLGHAGLGVTLTSPGAAWSGVAITRLDLAPPSDGLDTFVHYRLHSRLLCPGESYCEPAYQPYVATDDDGRGYAVLRPGTYGVALLGPRGAHVSAELHLLGPRKGVATLRPARAAAYQTTVFGPAVAAPGGDVASRGFARVGANDRHVVDSLAIGFVLSEGAAIHYAICSTGGSRHLDGTGGAVPCADHEANDRLSALHAQLVPAVPAGQMAAGIAWVVNAGRLREDSGLGYEAHVAGAGGRITGLHFAVAF